MSLDKPCEKHAYDGKECKYHKMVCCSVCGHCPKYDTAKYSTFILSKDAVDLVWEEKTVPAQISEYRDFPTLADEIEISKAEKMAEKYWAGTTVPITKPKPNIQIVKNCNCAEAGTNGTKNHYGNFWQVTGSFDNTFWVCGNHIENYEKANKNGAKLKLTPPEAISDCLSTVLGRIIELVKTGQDLIEQAKTGTPTELTLQKFDYALKNLREAG